MNKQSVITAAFFVLAALVFASQTLDNLGHGNFFALIFNASAAFFTGRLGLKHVRELLAARV